MTLAMIATGRLLILLTHTMADQARRSKRPDLATTALVRLRHMKVVCPFTAIDPRRETTTSNVAISSTLTVILCALDRPSEISDQIISNIAVQYTSVVVAPDLQPDLLGTSVLPIAIEEDGMPADQGLRLEERLRIDSTMIAIVAAAAPDLQEKTTGQEGLMNMITTTSVSTARGLQSESFGTSATMTTSNMTVAITYLVIADVILFAAAHLSAEDAHRGILKGSLTTMTSHMTAADTAVVVVSGLIAAARAPL